MVIRLKKKAPSKTEQSASASDDTQSGFKPGKASPPPVSTTAKAKPLPVPLPKPKTKVIAKPAKGARPDAGLGPPPLTLKQIAAHLGVCTKTVRRIIEKKSIPYGMVGGQIRIPAEHLPLFIDKQW